MPAGALGTKIIERKRQFAKPSFHPECFNMRELLPIARVATPSVAVAAISEQPPLAREMRVLRSA
jgi:hypothetical protein